jgi:hypothetical protein
MTSNGLPPLLFAGTRYVIAGARLCPIALRAATSSRGSAKDRAKPGAWAWFAGAVIGVLLLFAGNRGVTIGETTLSSGFAAIPVATVPLWMIVFAWPVGAQRDQRQMGAFGSSWPVAAPMISADTRSHDALGWPGGLISLLHGQGELLGGSRHSRRDRDLSRVHRTRRPSSPAVGGVTGCCVPGYITVHALAARREARLVPRCGFPGPRGHGNVTVMPMFRLP